jgi:hypothetical protein
MFRYYTRFREINGQPGGQYDILKAAYEVDKTLTNKENSWVNKINEISKLIGLSSFNISTFLFKQKLENYYKVKIETEISNIKNHVWLRQSVLRPFNKFQILILYYYTEGIEIKNVFRLQLDVYNTCKFFDQKELLLWYTFQFLWLMNEHLFLF